MKIGLIENRQKTFFWDAIAKEIQSEGNTITWLVQNPIFTPKTGKINLIPFPNRSNLQDPDENELKLIITSDRNINYFGRNAGHYNYYRKEIAYWLESEAPDLVIGESTLFHELLVIHECKKRNIPFLHPTTPGYPGGRFTIYSYDSKDYIGNSTETPNDAECLAIARTISKRERTPSYMIPPSAQDPERTYPLPGSLKDRINILHGYLMGEKFNTPSPWKKWKLDHAVKSRIKKWAKIAEKPIIKKTEHRIALYPLQMQPEANLDVWGRAFRDQTSLIKEIADALPNNWRLIVKSNPKCKYELSDPLLELLREHPKVSAAPMNISMGSILELADLVCTVTGTVAIECALSQKPLVQFGPGIVENGHGCLYINEASEIRQATQLIESGTFPIASEDDCINLVRHLYTSTFPGFISDPATNPEVMRAANIKAVTTAVINVSNSQVRCE